MTNTKELNKDSKLQLIFRALNNYGIIEVTQILLTFIFHQHGKKLILFALSDPKPIQKAIDASQKHLFKFATASELKKLCVQLKNDPDNYPSEKDFSELSEGRCRCLVQLDGDTLAGYAWVWNSKLAHIVDGFHLNLPDDTIYNYKGYTNPKYRGYGFQAMRHLKLLEFLNSEGITRLFGYVDRTNPRSLRGVAKSGYQPVGQLTISHYKNGDVSFKLKLDSHFWAKEART
jgi:hypothetical protein